LLPVLTPAPPNHEFPFWFNATYDKTLDNGSEAMIALLINNSMVGISQATRTPLHAQDLMTHVVFPLNNGSGIAVKLYFHNVTLADHLYDWMQAHGGIPVSFKGQQLMALGMPRDGPTAAPPVSPAVPDTPRWVVYLVTATAVAMLVVLVAAVGFRNWRQPKQARPAFDEFDQHQQWNAEARAAPLSMMTSGFTALHLAVFQGDVVVAQDALDEASAQPPTAPTTMASTSHSLASPASSSMFPNLDDLDDVMLDPGQVVRPGPASDAAETQASSSPGLAASTPSSTTSDPQVLQPQIQPSWHHALALQRQQQALVSWRRFGLTDEPATTLPSSQSRFQPPMSSRPHFNKAARQAALNSRDQQGHTPLAWSVRLNNFGMMQFLVQQGADVNIRDTQGQSPLHIAAMCSTPELMCGYLLKNGADPNALDLEVGFGCTSLTRVALIVFVFVFRKTRLSCFLAAWAAVTR
jgi:ankyrin repeat protein